MKTEKEKVVFRIYSDGEVIALFPQTIADMTQHHCESYMHVGQHGAADPDLVVRQTRLARPAEYRGLKQELKQIGYMLDVKSRCTQFDRQIRVKALIAYYCGGKDENGR